MSKHVYSLLCSMSLTSNLELPKTYAIYRSSAWFTFKTNYNLLVPKLTFDLKRAWSWSQLTKTDILVFEAKLRMEQPTQQLEDICHNWRKFLQKVRQDLTDCQKILRFDAYCNLLVHFQDDLFLPMIIWNVIFLGSRKKHPTRFSDIRKRSSWYIACAAIN